MRRQISVLDKKVLRDLWRVKGQAIAIILVIAAGIALFVMASGMTRALDTTMQAYYERHRFADIYAPIKRAPLYILETVRQLDGITDLEGRINGAGLVDVETEKAPISARIISYDNGTRAPINSLYLSDGRLPRPENADEVVLIKPFADAHGLEAGDTLNVTLNGAQQRFQIVGLAYSPEFIYAIAPGEFISDDSRYAIIWANRDALEAAFDLEGAFNEIVLITARGAQTAAIIDQLDHLLARYGATGAYAKKDQVSNRYLQEELSQLKTMSRVMPPIFLGVAIFLLNIVITRLIQTERDQIGLLKAYGYTNREIGLHYFKFVAVIALLGAIAGWVGGIYLGKMMSEIYQVYYHFPFLLYQAEMRTLWLAFLFSNFAAITGALNALRGAIRLTPAVAMRPPAPPKYRRGNSGSATWLGGLDQPTRMIFRRIAYQPMRAVLTTFGIGAAMGLAVMMQFNEDATHYMLEVNFNIIDRSDVAVTFTDPQSEKAIYELLSLEGVDYAEPFRASPVIFHHNGIEHLGSITALGENPTLNRAVDKNLLTIDINGNGIVLSEALASLLDIDIGETLTIAVREGRRPLLQVTVTGFIESLIGTPAYMTASAFNEYMLEPNLFSGAYLKVDPENQDALYDALKDIPKIAGVSLRREAYENLQKMLDEGVGTYRAIMSTFAVIIVIGVVYNSARIAYIERQHDLASLRVLGFTKLETGYVLLGELFLLTLCALPLGALFGFGLWSYMADAVSTELYQIPTIYKEDGLGYAAVVVLCATIAASAIVLRDIGKLEMATALKARE